ncbi:hypothetical protein C8J56DRAFT_436001 [Mycena floridula]|nr:hypothetical protein C8J56DRAFT_436001 [Mycena floridula]
MPSHTSQLFAAAALASATTATIFYIYYSTVDRDKRRKRLNEDVMRSIEANGSGFSRDLDQPSDTVPSSKPDLEDGESLAKMTYTEELIKEQLTRNYAFFGDEAMAKIRGGSVVIIGLGGVGSSAAVYLARSGVSRIRLVDFDYVSLSSLNRHATAVLSDVGTPKVKCVEKFLKQTCRWIDVDCQIEVWRKDSGAYLLEGMDWVIDAIDNIQTKVDLLKYCSDHDIKVFSSMGAGAKCDPTRIQISDISNTIYDPLARSVRRRLRLEGVSSGIPVVYSTEVPSEVKLLPLPEEEFQKGKVEELGVLPDFRVRILPVLGPIPSIFGLYAATYVLCELAGKPILNPLPVKNRKKIYERLLRELLAREIRLTGQNLTKLPIDEDDVSMIYEDLYRGRSIIPPHEVPSKAALVRWDVSKRLSLENCVVMEEKNAEQHVQASRSEEGSFIEPRLIWGDAVQDIVDARAKDIARYRQHID